MQPPDPHREHTVIPLRGAPPVRHNVPLYHADRIEPPVLDHVQELASIEILVRQADVGELLGDRRARVRHHRQLHTTHGVSGSGRVTLLARYPFLLLVMFKQ